MAISVLSKQSQSFGSLSGAVGQIQLDASYPTGGYTITPTTFALTNMSSFEATTTGGYILIYNYSTSKLMAFTAAGGAGGTTGATSGGTPAGSVTAPVLTMDSYTPAGTISTNSINETPAVVADAGTLAFTPVNITAFYATAAGTPGPLTVVPAPLAAAAGQVSVDFGTGAFTLFAGDTVTAVQVIYQNSGGNFTGTPLAPTGTASVPVFSGAALATHTHTIGASGGGLSEVSNGTNLSTVVGNYILMGY